MTWTWARVSVASPSDDLAGLVTEALIACGGLAIEENNGSLITYITAHADPDALTELTDRVRTALRDTLGTEPPQFDIERVPEQNWLALWRAGLEPTRVGEHVIVSPTWSDVEAAPDDVVVRIDPQMAFGTGEHASTRGVLRLMQRTDPTGARLLDVGTGSGILAITAVMLGAAHVLAVEGDPDAIPNAHDNIAYNRVSDRVTLVNAFVDDAFLTGHGPFDGILANVLSSVLRPLLPPFHDAIVNGGWAILSGILVEEADDMRAAANAAGFTISAEDSEAEWWSVLLRRA